MTELQLGGTPEAGELTQQAQLLAFERPLGWHLGT